MYRGNDGTRISYTNYKTPKLFYSKFNSTVMRITQIDILNMRDFKI